MRSRHRNLSAFTLIELLISMIILGVLASLIFGNFITSLKKGRDARRKADLGQIQQALEMYYEDKKAYPTAAAAPGFNFSGKLCESTCAENEKTYMQKVPNDPNTANSYQYASDGTYYRLFSCVENSLDQGGGVSQTGYTGAPANCGTGCSTCKYTVSSPNISPLPTIAP